METERKKIIIASVLKFLQQEVNDSNLCEEKKESVEVAIQCLETAYELGSDREKLEARGVDLLEAVPTPAKAAAPTEKQKEDAENFKTMGNNAMKNNEFSEALVLYTKAIDLNPNNAVYFCNRAAVYSKIEQHLQAIQDCKEAIRLDPTYGKAYGRLGIAYSNLNLFEEAQKAYTTALKYDPNNQMYESNLKLAEERLMTDQPAGPGGAPVDPSGMPFDLSQFVNNPALINMATQMLGDPRFRNMMSGIMNVNPTENPNFETLFQVGQSLANQMQDSDPNFVDNLRRSFQNPDSSSNNGENPAPEPPK